MKRKKRIITIILLVIIVFITFTYNRISLFSKVAMEIFKLNGSLATISSNFYDEPIKDISYKDVIFKKRDNLDLKLDIYSPFKESSNGSPVIIYVFGNAWMYGDKTLPSALSPVINALREEGYTIISTSYELIQDDIIFDKQISDIKDTIRWIYKNKEEYNFDTDSIGIIGPSAGAQLSMVAAYSDENEFIDDPLLSSYPSKVKYVIDMFGPSNLSKINLSTAPSDIVEKLNNSSITELSNKYSPINYIKANIPNTLIIHSKVDNIVPYNTSIELLNKAKEYNNNFEMYSLNDCTHYLENLSDSEAVSLYIKILNYIISNT